jgi:hypothetical protein
VTCIDRPTGRHDLCHLVDGGACPDAGLCGVEPQPRHGERKSGNHGGPEHDHQCHCRDDVLLAGFGHSLDCRDRGSSADGEAAGDEKAFAPLHAEKPSDRHGAGDSPNHHGNGDGEHAPAEVEHIGEQQLQTEQ